MIHKMENYYTIRENEMVVRKSGATKSGGNRFWSAFFPYESTQNTLEMTKKRRIFADPACKMKSEICLMIYA